MFQTIFELGGGGDCIGFVKIGCWSLLDFLTGLVSNPPNHLPPVAPIYLQNSLMLESK